MTTDLTFFTNEPGATLLDRFKRTLSDIKYFEVIATDFTQKQIDPANFAKKLLGQIVFLYFLQKKGWLGVEPGQPWGSGAKDFLRRLFQQDKKNSLNRDREKPRSSPLPHHLAYGSVPRRFNRVECQISR